MLAQLLSTCQAMGPHANFAALAEQLRAGGSDFDQLIAEISSEHESDIETVQLELAGAVRQTKMKALKIASDQLAATGLHTEESRQRYREIWAQQESLKREAEAEIACR